MPVLTRRGSAAVLDAATRRYLRGERIDMSEIAAELGVGRATVYRWAGNHDEVLGVVLAEQTERTFRRSLHPDDGVGADRVLRVMERFMAAVLDSGPLKTLTARDPVMFLRLATMPGAIEQRAVDLLAELLVEERDAGHLVLPLPVDVLAQAIVRVADAFMYRHLLGAGEPDLRSALDIVALLLRQEGPAAPGRP